MIPSNSRILIRAELNLPLTGDVPLSSFRLDAFIPTLKSACEKQNKIVIITHMGNPDAYHLYPSTRLLIPLFKKHNFTVQFASTIHDCRTLATQEKNNIILVENLRFLPQEKFACPLFLEQLSTLGDVFIQDAFGSLHSHDSSITQLPTYFAKNKRFLGQLVQKEIKHLNDFNAYAANQKLFLLSGGKYKKINYIEALLAKQNMVLVGPGLAIPFLCTLIHKKNCCFNDSSTACIVKNIMKKENLFKQLILPKDLYVTRLEKQLCIKTADLRPTDKVISVGKETIDLFIGYIEQHESICINGYMGFVTDPYCIKSMRILLEKAYQKSSCIVSGGDTVFFADTYTNRLPSVFRSTGGGATIAYLTFNALPGIEPFLK